MEIHPISNGDQATQSGGIVRIIRWLGRLVQRSWWAVCTLVRLLSPVRFSFSVALVGGSLFVFVQQGTEILRNLAERDQETRQLNIQHIAWFFGGLLLWSLNGWYWSRVLFNFQVPGQLPAPPGRVGALVVWCRRQGPRIVGVLPPLVIAYACFFPALDGYDDRGIEQPKVVLQCFGGAALAMALLLYGGFVLRRNFLQQTGRHDCEAAETIYRTFSDLRGDRGAWYAVLASTLLSAALVIYFLFSAVASGLAIGSGAILCLAAAAWVCFGSVLVWLSDHFRLPLVGALLVWVLVCSPFNDNHLVRTISLLPPENLLGAEAPGLAPPIVTGHWREFPSNGPVAQAFSDWAQPLLRGPQVAAADGSKPVQPVFIVATEGGGIRAAYWTALVLATLEDQSLEQAGHSPRPPHDPHAPTDFASHVFAISGVSGGSLGAAVFDALLVDQASHPGEAFGSPAPQMKALPQKPDFLALPKSPPLRAGAFALKAGSMLRQDFLSPTLAALLFPDFLQRFVPWPILAADRATALEEGWEYGWTRAIGAEHENLFAQPFLALWTHADPQNPGQSIRIPALFLNGTKVESGKRIITSNLRISSQVDGEFSDAEDAEDKITEAGNAACDMRVSTAAHMSARFTYVSPAGKLPAGDHVVDGGYFENSGATTALEVLYVVEAVINQNSQWPVQLMPVVIEIRNGPGAAAPPPKLVKKRSYLGELLDPIVTLFNTRDARGSFSQAAIESEQEEGKADKPWAPLFTFGLGLSKVPLPLGWMLSGGAAREMQRQMHAHQPKNQEALNSIIQTLQPAVDEAGGQPPAVQQNDAPPPPPTCHRLASLPPETKA